MSVIKNVQQVSGSSQNQNLADLVKKLYEKQKNRGDDIGQYKILTKKLTKLLGKLFKQYAHEEFAFIEELSEQKRQKNEYSQLKKIQKQRDDHYTNYLKCKNEKTEVQKMLSQYKKKLDKLEEENKLTKKLLDQSKLKQTQVSSLKKQPKESNDLTEQKLVFDEFILKIYEKNKSINDCNKFTTGVINKIIVAHKKQFDREYSCKSCEQLEKDLNKSNDTILQLKDQLKKFKQSKSQLKEKLNFESKQLNLIRTKTQTNNDIHKQKISLLEKDIESKSNQIAKLTQQLKIYISRINQLENQIETLIEHGNKKEHIKYYIKKIYNNIKQKEPQTLPSLKNFLISIVEKIDIQYNTIQ